MKIIMPIEQWLQAIAQDTKCVVEKRHLLVIEFNNLMGDHTKNEKTIKCEQWT